MTCCVSAHQASKQHLDYMRPALGVCGERKVPSLWAHVHCTLVSVCGRYQHQNVSRQRFCPSLQLLQEWFVNHPSKQCLSDASRGFRNASSRGQGIWFSALSEALMKRTGKCFQSCRAMPNIGRYHRPIDSPLRFWLNRIGIASKLFGYTDRNFQLSTING